VKSAGVWLVVASVAFWLSWALMPGVGVTDTATILATVGRQRPMVLASVLLQLASAVAYAPGIVTLLVAPPSPTSRGIRTGCALLLVGAMGSAADAIFHLVAYEMTAPGIPPEAVAPVMRKLQGPDLGLLLPFVVAFFAGHAILVPALRTRVPRARHATFVLLAAPVILVAGVPMVRLGLVPGRIVGLGFLAAVAGSLATIGASLALEKGARVDE
jgi:hypothetical protein